MSDREDMDPLEGGDAAALEKAIARADPNRAMAIHWLGAGIGPSEVALKLAAADAAFMPTREALEDYAARWRKTRDAAGILWDLLAAADRLAGFGSQAPEFPADHGVLVRDLALISRPVFPIADVAQTIEPDGCCLVRFDHGGASHSFAVASRGRSYDVEAVLRALNDVLAGAGRSERFLQLYTGDRTRLVLFAREAPVREAARELRIPLLQDPARARRGRLALVWAESSEPM